MNNLKFEWVYNNLYNTKILKSVKINNNNISETVNFNNKEDNLIANNYDNNFKIILNDFNKALYEVFNKNNKNVIRLSNFLKNRVNKLTKNNLKKNLSLHDIIFQQTNNFFENINKYKKIFLKSDLYRDISIINFNLNYQKSNKFRIINNFDIKKYNGVYMSQHNSFSLSNCKLIILDPSNNDCSNNYTLTPLGISTCSNPRGHILENNKNYNNDGIIDRFQNVIGYDKLFLDSNDNFKGYFENYNSNVKFNVNGENLKITDLNRFVSSTSHDDENYYLNFEEIKDYPIPIEDNRFVSSTSHDDENYYLNFEEIKNYPIPIEDNRFARVTILTICPKNLIETYTKKNNNLYKSLYEGGPDSSNFNFNLYDKNKIEYTGGYSYSHYPNVNSIVDNDNNKLTKIFKKNLNDDSTNNDSKIYMILTTPTNNIYTYCCLAYIELPQNDNIINFRMTIPTLFDFSIKDKDKNQRYIEISIQFEKFYNEELLDNKVSLGYNRIYNNGNKNYIIYKYLTNDKIRSFIFLKRATTEATFKFNDFSNILIDPLYDDFESNIKTSICSNIITSNNENQYKLFESFIIYKNNNNNNFYLKYSYLNTSSGDVRNFSNTTKVITINDILNPKKNIDFDIYSMSVSKFEQSKNIYYLLILYKLEKNYYISVIKYDIEKINSNDEFINITSSLKFSDGIKPIDVKCEQRLNCIQPGNLDIFNINSDKGLFFIITCDSIERMCLNNLGKLYFTKYNIKFINNNSIKRYDGYFPNKLFYNSDLNLLSMYCDIFTKRQKPSPPCLNISPNLYFDYLELDNDTDNSIITKSISINGDFNKNIEYYLNNTDNINSNYNTYHLNTIDLSTKNYSTPGGSFYANNYNFKYEIKDLNIKDDKYIDGKLFFKDESIFSLIINDLSNNKIKGTENPTNYNFSIKFNKFQFKSNINLDNITTNEKDLTSDLYFTGIIINLDSELYSFIIPRYAISKTKIILGNENGDGLNYYLNFSIIKDFWASKNINYLKILNANTITMYTHIYFERNPGRGACALGSTQRTNCNVFNFFEIDEKNKFNLGYRMVYDRIIQSRDGAMKLPTVNVGNKSTLDLNKISVSLESIVLILLVTSFLFPNFSLNLTYKNGLLNSSFLNFSNCFLTIDDNGYMYYKFNNIKIGDNIDLKNKKYSFNVGSSQMMIFPDKDINLNPYLRDDENAENINFDIATSPILTYANIN